MTSETSHRINPRWTAAIGGLVLAVVVVAALAVLAARTTGELTNADAALLGVIEGATEFLPISSTGHLTVTERLLDIGDDPAEKEAADAYAIAIQAGAILAVLVLYRSRIASIGAGVLGRDADGRRLALVLVSAFIPAAFIGLLFEDFIKDHLFGVGPVVAAWAVGGVVVLVLADRIRGGDLPLEQLAVRQGFIIGAAQVLALWPGTSRSLVTILAALALGATSSAAVEFSFLLGLLTLGAATAYEAVTSADVIVDEFGIAAPLVGFAGAFLAAVIAIRWMVDYLSHHSLAIFGWYRIAIAVIAGAFLLTGVL